MGTQECGDQRKLTAKKRNISARVTSRLQIDDAQLRLLKVMVEEGYPHETCGLLIGARNNGHIEVNNVHQARNLNTQRAEDRYELDPTDLVAAENLARDNNLEVVGIWHSHPDHPAKPSETDRQAAWEGWSYMILSVTKEGVEDVRSWRLTSEQQFIEEELQQ